MKKILMKSKEKAKMKHIHLMGLWSPLQEGVVMVKKEDYISIVILTRMDFNYVILMWSVLMEERFLKILMKYQG